MEFRVVYVRAQILFYVGPPKLEIDLKLSGCVKSPMIPKMLSPRALIYSCESAAY